MRLQFLGTSASEGYPNAFCECENCTAARAAGGPSLRKRTAALIDERLLIDLGPDLMAAALQHGFSLAGIEYCLQTHEHHDHFDPSHFFSRSQYCGVYNTPRLHYCASRGALEKAASHFGRRFGKTGLPDQETEDALNLSTQVVAPFIEFCIGPYTVFPVRANHAQELTALLYVITRAGRTLFYCTDTGELPEETWSALDEYIRRHPERTFDVVVMDHTFGLQGRSGGHMNREQFVEQMARMRELGLLSAGARVYATHIAHHSNPIHEELAAQAQAYGYLVGYDGLDVEV
jgi:phosphoribosyl 1,2-cyclic phosphate phosphodiesterase